MRNPFGLKKRLKSLIQREAPEWLDPQVVRLGKDSTQLIQTGTPGLIWARLMNGKPIQVHVGNVYFSPRFDLRVRVGRKKSQPNLWQIIEVLEDYDTPVGNGELFYHHEQHEEGGSDRVNLSRKQIMARTVRVKNSASFIVRVYGDADLTPSGWKLIPHQDITLSSYVPTTGARFVAIESDNNGALSVNSGTVFGSPAIATPANYPVPATGKYPIARVLLFEGQTALLDEHISVSMPPSFNPAGYSSTGHVHVLDDLTDVDTPSPTDGQVLTWDAYAEEWIAADPTGGSGEGGSHVHGLARWNGASGQTTFDLPDIWEYVDSVMLNGLEEDPIAYSLSSDGAQIVLDTALTSDTLVMAHGVIRSI